MREKEEEKGAGRRNSNIICLWLKSTQQRIRWATQMSRYLHSLLAKKVGASLTWCSEEWKTHQSLSPTGKKKHWGIHTDTHTQTLFHTHLQQNSTDGICCNNIHNTFKREQLTLTDLNWQAESNQRPEESVFYFEKVKNKIIGALQKLEPFMILVENSGWEEETLMWIC